MRPSIYATLLMLFVTLAVGFGGANVVHFASVPAEPEGAIATAKRDGDVSDIQMEHLRALGYVDWDESANSALSGVTLRDSERVEDGYGIHTNDRWTAFLTDLDGNVVHEWSAPEGSGGCEFAELLPNDLLAMVCLNRSVIFLDWDSNIVHQEAMHVHHEAAPIGESAVLVPVHERYAYRGRDVVFDAIMRVEPGKAPERIWGTWEARHDLLPHHGPQLLDDGYKEMEDRDWNVLNEGYDYYHLNSIQVLPSTPLGARDDRFKAGNLLVSLRNTHQVVILDSETFSVVWSWGPGEIELQHYPRMLADGNILLFDNGTFRQWSRVIEINPATREIVWEHRGEGFYSAYRGNAQRLENGNTLICQSEIGRVFEVTKEGEVVWDFWNPEFRNSSTRRLIYRFNRFPAARIEAIAGRAGKQIARASD